MKKNGGRMFKLDDTDRKATVAQITTLCTNQYGAIDSPRENKERKKVR